MAREVQPIPERLKLPTTRSEFLALRTLKSHRSLIDLVEQHYLALYENEDFRRLTEAVTNDQAVTGNLTYDECRAVDEIVARAEKTHDITVAEALPYDIGKALRYAMRRYQCGRQQRLKLLNGHTNGHAAADGGSPAETE